MALDHTVMASMLLERMYASDKRKRLAPQQALEQAFGPDLHEFSQRFYAQLTYTLQQTPALRAQLEAAINNIFARFMFVPNLNTDVPNLSAVPQDPQHRGRGRRPFKKHPLLTADGAPHNLRPLTEIDLADLAINATQNTDPALRQRLSLGMMPLLKQTLDAMNKPRPGGGHGMSVDEKKKLEERLAPSRSPSPLSTRPGGP